MSTTPTPEGLSDEQIMEIGFRHFKPDPDLTDKTKGAFIAAVRDAVALIQAVGKEAIALSQPPSAQEGVREAVCYIHRDQLAHLQGRPVDDSDACVRYANGFPTWVPDSIRAEYLPLALAGQAKSAAPVEPAGWIDVNVRKPEKNVEVLIAFRDTPLPATGQYTAHPRDTWGWSFPSENDPDDTGPITHWLPLPGHPAPQAGWSTTPPAAIQETPKEAVEAMRPLFETWEGRSKAPAIPEPADWHGWQVSVTNGHSGYGVYAHMTEYPEEGAIFLLALDPASPVHVSEAPAQTKCGRVEIKGGRVKSYAFEQTDIADGEYLLHVATPEQQDTNPPKPLRWSESSGGGYRLMDEHGNPIDLTKTPVYARLPGDDDTKENGNV